ncbi:PAS domain-containing sensor histidine kinase [Ferruginibacter sp. SUN106]|uniref:PAS domain-containing sensor histidine kinase n=1 Tax=Ferruginibacter sp. SUN106 TaxID=2978348 RepID=UPI003D36737D
MKNQNSIQNSPDAIYTCDQKGFIKSYNKAAVNLWGRKPAVGKDLWCGSWKIFDKNGGHLPVDKHPMTIALREGRLVHGEELIVQRPDGSLRYVSPYSSPLVNANGHLTGVVSMLIEISEQKNKARLSEEKYRNLIEQAADGIFLFDLKGHFVSVNTSGAKMLGYDIESLLQLNIIHILPLQFIDKIPVSMASLSSGNPVLVERMFKRKDGSLFYAEVRAQMVLDGNIQAIVRDITDRKKAEQDFRMMKKALMNQKVEEQKTIARAILNAQEKERRHIGEELHDNINQMLAGIKLYLSVASNGNARLKEALQYPIELIEKTMTEIRLLTKRSVTLKQNINLKDLLQTLVDTMFKSTAIKTCFVYKVVNECLDDELKLNIYRILQEQTNNIMKHACAATVNISVKANDHILNVVVSDDGNGFDINKKREGIGMSNIINRVESFNGEVVIESAPGNGCKLRIKIPY